MGNTFVNFDGPNSGNAAGTGTNANGITNNGAVVGFGIDNAANFTNFVRNPDGTFTTLNIGIPGTAMAMGINSAGDVVGTQNGTAFFLPSGGAPVTLTTPAGATTAFGINDRGNIVGQSTSGTGSPGFFLASSAGNGLVTINAPSGPNVVNAQGVNNNGLVAGFHVGTDGQDHGFTANVASAMSGGLTGTPVADPIIPTITGEPGAKFVFSQLLGINDSGIGVGYYGDSTASQHGFFYNTNTGAYTFLDDPAEQFDNGVEVTQITGINNLGRDHRLLLRLRRSLSRFRCLPHRRRLPRFRNFHRAGAGFAPFGEHRLLRSGALLSPRQAPHGQFSIGYAIGRFACAIAQRRIAVILP